MNDEDKKNSNQFDASLPLPLDKKHASAKITHGANQTAADLIRKKVNAAYADEPLDSSEALDMGRLGDSLERSKHQEFIYELTNSGKPLHDIQAAWHEYYAALSEAEKHDVWQEFYNTHRQAGGMAEEMATLPAQLTEETLFSHQSHRPASIPAKPLHELRKRARRALPAKAGAQPASPLRSLLFGLGAGCIVMVVFLFGFFNERIVAPFIQPSRNVTNTPIISGSVIDSNPEIVIPKINVEIPVVYDIKTIDEAEVERGLEQGVVHYADTSFPGQNGNVVVVGHSSNNIFNPGKYKFAFVLLSRLENGDTFYLQKDGKRYTYQVYKKVIVSPSSVEVLGPQDKPATASLITCDPPGTSAKRLVVVGEQIDPSPAANVAQAATPAALAATTKAIPGNSPTLWSRLLNWLQS